MSRKSNINIFNVMSASELDKELKNPDNSRREYQRFVAMKAISNEIPFNKIAEILGVSYRSINRWARDCSVGGIENLKPNFNGGRKSKLTPEQKIEFGEFLYNNGELSMMEARQYLIDNYGIKFSLTHVANITKKLGFNYAEARPKFKEAPLNNEKILIDNIKAANITKEDIVIGADESTMKKTIRTPKQFIFKNTKKNNEK